MTNAALIRPLLWSALVSSGATLASYLTPEPHGATAVGLVFLGATSFLCLRPGVDPGLFGLSLGGLLETTPLNPKRMVRESSAAIATAMGATLVIFPFFTIGFWYWHKPELAFSFLRGLHGTSASGPLWDVLFGNLLVVALPEEAFFRGYLQSTLGARHRDPGLRERLSDWTLTSAIFALGHLTTAPHPARLAVFFPSLIFCWLRHRTAGIGAALVFHALCNVYAVFLSAAYGLG